jgi:hypothetical protein
VQHADLLPGPMARIDNQAAMLKSVRSNGRARRPPHADRKILDDRLRQF